jgi:hypothetical protein
LKEVSLHPEELEEAFAAVEWYGRRSTRASHLFLDEVDRLIARIAENSAQFQPFAFQTRRAALRKFVWSPVFREFESGVEIIAVAHNRRRPGYSRHRE